MERWTELRTAYQVAKLGTVSEASRALGVHRATVNRHIDALERELGARIFIRSAKGYALTDLGSEVLKVAQTTEALFDDLVGRAKGSDGRIEGEIKLTALSAFTHMLMPAVSAFRAENPNCQVTLTATPELQRLEHGEAHIAVRAGRRPDHPDYVVQPFGRIGLNLYAHDSYIARYGMPEAATDLKEHLFVLPPVDEGRVPIREWIAAIVPEPKVAVAALDPVVSREAILAGLGIGILSEVDAAAREDVHAVLPPNRAWVAPLWLVTHMDLHRTEKVQAMLRCIKALRGARED